ncbi:MAG: methylenetetrahydrofolate reductase [Gammaproteobacteria bacterium]|jgi:methylenetetrahydrofolate reductase (NADPH)
MEAAMEQTQHLSGNELLSHVQTFVDDYSIETTTHDEAKFDEISAELRPGTRVYVAHVPGTPIDDVVSLALRFKDAGFTPVPHIIARKLSSAEQLEGALKRLQAGGVDQALCIAGDIAVDDNAFDSSLEVLQTGLFGECKFAEVGVAAHPEGSAAIGEARVAEALAGKAEFAKTAPFKLRFVSQFGFDARPFFDWERETSAQGIDLPIHVGLAGPASLKQLARFAVVCGVGASARMLKSRTSATANLLKSKAPDDLVVEFARHQAANPATRIRSPHIFAFGGVAKSARWINAVRDGRIKFNRRETGFDVV